MKGKIIRTDTEEQIKRTKIEINKLKELGNKLVGEMR